MGVILRAHHVYGDLHIQRNANREVATTPLPMDHNGMSIVGECMSYQTHGVTK